MISQGQSLTDAIRHVGVTAMTYHRRRQELGAPKNDHAKRQAESGQEAPKRVVEGEVTTVRDPAQSKSKPETTGFEE